MIRVEGPAISEASPTEAIPVGLGVLLVLLVLWRIRSARSV
jgi:hypothetical protein